MSERSRRSAALWALMGDLLPMAIALLAAPVLFKLLGAERMGVLSLIWVLVGYLSFLDLGLGRAVTVAIAAAQPGGKDVSAELRITGSAVCALLVLGSASSIVLAAALHAMPLPLRFSSSALENEVRAALTWALPSLPLLLASAALRGHLEGIAAFRQLNLVRIPAGAMLVLAPLLTAHITPDLSWAALSLFAVRGMQFLALLATVASRQEMSAPKLLVRLLASGERRQLQQLLSFGGWLSVSSVLGPVIVYADRFVIGALVGAGAVSLYAIPFDVVSRVPILVASGCAVLLPALVQAFHAAQTGTGAAGQWQQLLRRAWLLVAGLVVSGALVGWFAAPHLLTWWMGAAFAAESQATTRILLIAFLVNALAQIPYLGLLALKKTRLVAAIHLLEALPSLLVLWWAVFVFGILGAACCCLGRAVVDCALMTFALRSSVPDRTPQNPR